GSVEAAKAMMTAATAVVRAGGHGVFIDNSGLAHGRDDWFNLAEDKNAGGLYWAYVAGNQDNAQQVVFSCGMHCLGLRDAELPTREISDTQFAGFLLHNFLGYTYQSGRTIHDGDIVGGGPDQPDSPTFRAHQALCTRFAAGTPFHNPYGIWRLERMWPEEVQELKVEP